MKELFVEAVLYLGIIMPGTIEYPPQWVEKNSNELPITAKQRVADFFHSRGLYDPNNTTIDWDWFNGAYNVLWRRAAGRPFPYPTDPQGPIINNGLSLLNRNVK